MIVLVVSMKYSMFGYFFRLIRILYGKFEAWLMLHHHHGTECQPQETGHSGQQHTRWWRGGGDQGPGNGRAQGLRHAQTAVSLPGKDSVNFLKELRKLLSSAISLFSGIKKLCHHSPSSSLKLIILWFVDSFDYLYLADIWGHSP